MKGQIHVNECGSTSYSVAEHNSSSIFPFVVDAHSGVIKVIRELDRETQSFYKFSIEIPNSTTQTEIHVNILDRNDHYPIFDDSFEQYIYVSTHQYYHQNNQIFITHIHATDLDEDVNGLVNYYFTNKDHYNYFHIYYNGSVILYNLHNLRLPIRLEIYARDHGSPKALESKETLVVYVCDIFAQNECPSNKLRRNFYVGSIIIMIAVVLFLLTIIMCIIWNLFIKDYCKKKDDKRSYHCQMEARKNLSMKIIFC